MKKHKLLLSLATIATVAGTVVSLSGCSRKGFTDFELPEDFSVEKFKETTIDISFYSTMGTDLKKAFDEGTIAEFNKIYPHINITHSSLGGYDDVRNKISTEVSVGTAPNLAYCYPDHVALYNLANSVLTLDDFINDTTYKNDDGSLFLGLTKEQQEDFIPGFWEEGKSYGDGKMYTLPFSKSTEILYYNKTVFDELKLNVPTTWDEMEDVCAKLKEKYPNSIPLGYDSDSNWFITMCEQMKIPYTSASGTTPEEHFLFNNDQAKQFLTRFKGWYEKGYVTTQEIYKSYTSGLFKSTDNEKKNGRSFMTIGSSAGASHQIPDKTNDKYPFEVGVAPIPQYDANNKKVISQGPSICIFKNDDPYKVVASYLFLKYITTDVPSQGDFGIRSGYVPVIKSVAENEIYKNHMSKEGTENLTAMAAKLCNEMEDYYFTSPAFPGSSDARDLVGQALAAAFLGTKTVDQALQDAYTECEYRNS